MQKQFLLVTGLLIFTSAMPDLRTIANPIQGSRSLKKPLVSQPSLKERVFSKSQSPSNSKATNKKLNVEELKLKQVESEQAQKVLERSQCRNSINSCERQPESISLPSYTPIGTENNGTQKFNW